MAKKRRATSIGTPSRSDPVAAAAMSAAPLASEYK
jgi:hypothetical protein